MASTEASRFPLFLLLLVLILTLLISTALAGGPYHHALQWAPSVSSCDGSIGECSVAGEEFELDSESNRRFLATNNYISYDALRRDSIPCSQRGASYYNCRPGAAANPYTRGCSAITRCRS